MTGAASPRCIAIVPYRERPGVKSRLAKQLSPEQRLQLARMLLARVLDALLAARTVASVLLVGDAPMPASLATNRRIKHVDTPLPLNESVALGCDFAGDMGATEVLVVHADLPALTAEFLDQAVSQGRALAAGRRAALASCQRADGTNLLWLSPATGIEFRYGPGSRRRHLDMLRQAGYQALELPAIADVDTDEDLALLTP